MGNSAATGAANFIGWGPYIGAGEASAHLIPFTNVALDVKTGIIWTDGRACMVLRQPVLDSNGFGQTLIAQWVPTPPPPPPPKNLGQRVEAFFENAMTTYGEEQMAEAQANMAMNQALLNFLGSNTGEHTVGLGFDLLGLLAFALLFVPVVGEAEMGVMATLAAVAPYTGAIAGVGAGLGGVLTIRDLGNISKTAGKVESARATADALQAQQASKLAKADQLAGRAANAPQWHANALDQKAATLRTRAVRLADKAAQADNRASQMAHKLRNAVMINAPSSFAAPAVAGGFTARDNWNTPAKPFQATVNEATAMRDWIVTMLWPQHSNASTMPAGHISLQTGVSSKSAANQ